MNEQKLNEIKEEVFLHLLETLPKAIKVKHPSILDITEGKHFWEMPISHYKSLCESIGKAETLKALCNIEKWNKVNHPEISKRARKIVDQIKD